MVNGETQDSDGKTDRTPWMLALDPATVKALREWRAQQRSEAAFFETDYQGTTRVFTWEDGRPVHPDVIRQRFNRLSLRCGLPHIQLHDMRHSYATAALKAGVHLKIVSARLGHASETFTASVYQHALPGMDREAAGTVAALFVDGDEPEDADPVTRAARATALANPLAGGMRTAPQMISEGPFCLVEVLRRYSNREDLTKSVQNVLRRIADHDRTNEPGVPTAGGPAASRRRLSEAQRLELIESFRRGASVRALAKRYGVGESCVKTALWRRGVGRNDRC